LKNEFVKEYIMKLFAFFCLSVPLCFLSACRNTKEEKPEPPKTYANSAFAERVWVNWETSQAEAQQENPQTTKVIGEEKDQLEVVRKYIIEQANAQPKESGDEENEG
jgi:hypothetical protein